MIRRQTASQDDAIQKFLTDALNSALGQDMSTTSHAFSVQIDADGFTFVPIMPAAFVLDSALYERIYDIASTVLYPYFTVLKSPAPILVKTSDQLNRARGFRFNWLRGVSKRLVVSRISDIIQRPNLAHCIPLMADDTLNVDIEKVYHIAIAGNSGSGKSTFLNYLLHIFQSFGDIDVVDPKFAEISRWAASNDINYLAPNSGDNYAQFIADVAGLLSSNVDEIRDRQAKLFDNPETKFRHKFVVIDELLALTIGTDSKKSKEIFNLISQIALLGRATRVHLVLVSQRFDAQALPTSARAQFNMLVQLGTINSETTQFLFPSLKTDNIAIPPGIGSGLIQLIDAEHPANVLPFLAPFVKDMGE